MLHLYTYMYLQEYTFMSLYIIICLCFYMYIFFVYICIYINNIYVYIDIICTVPGTCQREKEREAKNKVYTHICWHIITPYFLSIACGILPMASCILFPSSSLSSSVSSSPSLSPSSSVSSSPSLSLSVSRLYFLKVAFDHLFNSHLVLLCVLCRLLVEWLGHVLHLVRV